MSSVGVRIKYFMDVCDKKECLRLSATYKDGEPDIAASSAVVLSLPNASTL